MELHYGLNGASHALLCGEGEEEGEEEGEGEGEGEGGESLRLMEREKKTSDDEYGLEMSNDIQFGGSSVRTGCQLNKGGKWKAVFKELYMLVFQSEMTFSSPLLIPSNEWHIHAVEIFDSGVLPNYHA